MSALHPWPSSFDHRLARAADRLGKLLEGQLTDGSSSGGGGDGGGGGRSKNAVKIGTPRFIRLVESGLGSVEAEFEVWIRNQSGSELKVTAVAGAVIDGALSGEQIGPNGQPIRVRGWETAGGKSAR